MPLPVEAIVPELTAGLRAGTGAVLIAPPGAGKTTGIAPALIAERWCQGQVLLLAPRRVAARAAAERMAGLRGEPVGATIGYRTRMDSRVSPQSRIIVMTEAIFVAQIADDPELAGVSAVLFDEAHERNLDSDLGLALALEARAVLRPDLRVLVMSATIDGARFAALLGDDARVIASEGKAHPLAIRWLGASAEQRIEEQMARAIRTAWRETADEPERDLLAFLPGVREIERTAERLAATMPDALVLPLHGQCDPTQQRRALVRDPAGRRRIVLATAIAETSLTLDGVSVVIDSGLARRPQHDREAGLTRLVTARVSRASAEQRAGRAARQRAGICYRLWEEAGHGGLIAYDPPEILAADLSSLVLTLARWGSPPEALRWLDPPPAPALAAARARLAALDALDEGGNLTARGAHLQALGMAPPLGAMLLFAARHGAAETAARLALLLQEQRLGGAGEDLAARLERWNRDMGARAGASRKLAARWARRAERIVAARDDDAPPLSVMLATAFPDRLARRRHADSQHWLTAGGRGLRLDPASPLGCAEWLAVGAAQGHAGGARITAAAALSSEEAEAWLGRLIERRRVLRWNGDRVEARVQRRLGAITLAEGPDPDPDGERIAAMLIDRLRQQGGTALPLADASRALLARAAFAGVEALSWPRLIDEAEQWLAPLLDGRTSLATLDPRDLHEALRERIDWHAHQQLDRVAPAQFETPAGTCHPIDYAAEGGAQVAVRVQALFGLDRHPQFGSPPRPLLLQLTSPAGRAIQATRDLPGFWRGSWGEVRREMKGRYPKHRWPERPWEEAPSLKTRNAFENRR